MFQGTATSPSADTGASVILRESPLAIAVAGIENLFHPPSVANRGSARASPESRPILRYDDYALDSTPNPFDYFVVTARVNPIESFNLVAETPLGSDMFSQGQTWVLDGWTRLGGTLGQYRFSLTVPGEKPENGMYLQPPDGSQW